MSLDFHAQKPYNVKKITNKCLFPEQVYALYDD